MPDRKQLVVHVLLLFLVLLPGIGVSQVAPKPLESSSELEQLLKAKLSDLRKEDGFPGATMAIVLPDGRSMSVATGYADVESATPMRPHDKMLAGSIGKTFVAALMLHLVQEHKAGLEDKISRWFGSKPWFAHIPNANDITVRMLLNHTSGIPDDESFLVLQKDFGKTWTPDEHVATVLDKTPVFPAGKGWSYTDMNYILLGMVIEEVTHTSYYDVLKKLVLLPLNLKDTSPSDKRIIPGLVSGYANPKNPFGFSEKACVGGKCALNPQFEWTGGGLVSTSQDLAQWAKALYGGRVLNRKLSDEMVSGAVDLDKPTNSGYWDGKFPGHKYGLGVLLRQGPLGPAYGHAGYFPGFLSLVYYYPQYDLAAAMQINTDYFKGKNKVNQLLEEHLDTLAEIVVREQGLKKDQYPRQTR